MNNRIDRFMPFALPIILFALIIWYYNVNPTIQHYPLQCIWKALTGTQCPACGFQRALHALLHGKIGEAFSYNYFFIFSIPLALGAILSEWYNYHHIFDRLRTFIHNSFTLKMYIVFYFAWWIFRNIFNL